MPGKEEEERLRIYNSEASSIKRYEYRDMSIGNVVEYVCGRVYVMVECMFGGVIYWLMCQFLCVVELFIVLL